MVAGRLHCKKKAGKVGGRGAVAAFDFEDGSLVLSEASTKKRASLHFVAGRAALEDFDRGGIEVLDAPLDRFRLALTRENHTLKRALTDPRLFSGIGNAYSDEILPREALRQAHAKISEGKSRRYGATRAVFQVDRGSAPSRGELPEKVTAFRRMAVHGRYGKPCPVCGTPVQRIVYAENEANYCPTCQTGGKLLADRALSQLLRGDWPKTLEELEERKRDAAPRVP